MAAKPELGAPEGAIGALLARLGRGGRAFLAEPLAAGGNNRVYRVQAGSERFIAKWYFHSESDSRDRLGSEFAFLEHAWGAGLRCVPRPLARDPALHLGLYEFVEGRRLAPAEVGRERVVEAARFFAALNEPSSRRRGASLPAASEACFSVNEHLDMVEARLARFSRMRVASSVDREAATFVEELRRAWSVERRRILSSTRDPGEALPERWRCLSPSDFGFHNALLRPGGELCFLDFEYAGWDDPAKGLGDFFAHPGCPVARQHLEAFALAAAAPFEDGAVLIGRARLLEPVFRVKWCCIILNEFLADAAERRRFANPGMDPEQSKLAQLEKARRLSIIPAA
jgi:hypothetical protein